MFQLDNKIALVTGAGSGIGREIALLYARQGAKVVVADVNHQAAELVVGEIMGQGGVANVQALDVSNEAQVEAAIEETVRRYGRLDILVNNAGISSVGNLLETSSEEFDKIIMVNLK